MALTSITKAQVKIKTYDKYDTYGNILEETEANGTHVVTRYDPSDVLPIAKFAGATYDQTYIDNFSAGTLDGWTQHDQNPYVNTTWSVENGKLVQVSNPPSASNWGTDYLLHSLSTALTGKIVMEFDVTLPLSDGWDLVISMGDDTYSGGNTATGCAIWSGFDQNNWRYYAANGSWYYIATNLTVGKTYHLKIVVNTSSHTADYYVDGKKVLSGGAFRNSSISSIKNIAYGYYGHNNLGATWYIDNIRVYPEQAMAYSQGFDPVTYNITDQTDENGATTSYSYDDFNRLARVQGPDKQWLTQYAYSYSSDRHGGTFDVSDPNFTQTISYTDPDGFDDFTVNNGWTVSGSDISFNYPIQGVPTVKMQSATGSWDSIHKALGSGDVVARTDVYLSSGVNGSPHVLAFNDGSYRFGINYSSSTNNFYVETEMPGVGFLDPYYFSLNVTLDRWYTVEIIKRSDGSCQGWVYPKGENRDYADTYTKSGYPVNWSTNVYSWSNSTAGFFYLAHCYVGSFEQNTTWVDGLGRTIETQGLAGDANNETITAGTYYDVLGRPVVNFRPIENSGVVGYQTNLYQSGWTPGGALTSGSVVYNYYNSSTFPNYSTDAPYAYAEKTYYSDPLDRVDQTGGAGADFRIGAGHETTYNYGVNTSSSDTFTGYGVNTLTKTTVEDPNHHNTITYKDGFGQTIANVVDMDGNGVKSSGDLVTQFQYDALGNLTKTTDPKGLVTGYVYDGRGDLVSKKMPDQDDSTDYQYDKAGKLRFARDPNHKTGGGFIYYKYDYLERVTEVGQYNGSSSDFTNTSDIDNDSWPTSSNQPYIKYYYGPNNGYSGTYSGSLNPENLIGRLAHVRFLDPNTSQWSDTWYSYDNQGNVEWVVQSLNGLSSEKVIEYSYSPQGQLIKLSYQPFTSLEAHFFWYTYDPHGNLTTVYSNDVDDPTTWTRDAAYTYFPDGQVRELDLGTAAQKVDYAYDVQGWLKKINNPGNLTGNSGYADDRFAQELYYTSGSTPQYNGNISKIAWKLAPSLISSSDTPVYNFSYDIDDRLTSSGYYNSGSGSGETDTYSYDPNGNRTGLLREFSGGINENYGYVYSSGTNRLSQVNYSQLATTSYLNYDDNGNTVRSDLRGISSGVYDWRNLPEYFSLSNGKTLSFAYDSEGNRVKKSLSGGATTYYINGTNGQTMAAYDGSGNLLWINILAGGKVIGKIQP